MPLEFIEMVKAGGAILAPVFMYLWWYEREDRKAEQTKNSVLAEKTVTAMVEFKNLLQTVIDLLNGKRK